MDRSLNATRNVIFGIIYRIVITICPFIIRTVLLYVLGVEYLGLNSLFTSLLSFLSLAELGVGSALVYAMYKPIAEGDDDAVCALLKLYKTLYRIIGLVILGIGLILLPFVRHLVYGSYPEDINLYILYLIYLFNTVISYFMFGYKQSILNAFQRKDIISRRSMFVQMAMYVVQIIALFLFKNYYIYILLLPVFTVITNLANSIIVDKLYPQYVCKGEVTSDMRKDIRRNVLSLIGGKLSNTVLHSSDTLIISMFLGLSAVAIYGNYFYVLNAVAGFTQVIYDSITAGLGNSLVTETREKNKKDFHTLSFINAWMIGWCTICLICLFQPFMQVWVGEDLMFPFTMVLLFGVYFYVYQINKVVLTYKDAGGLWWQDRFRPYVVMATNLILNIVSIQFIGVYGVILSTIVSLIISVPWSTYVMYSNLFNESLKQYYISFFKYALITAIACVITYLICSLINCGEILNIVIRFIICCILPNAIYLLFSFKDPSFKLSVQRVTSVMHRVIKR